MKFSASFETILNKIEELIKEGNVRRIIIKDGSGNIFMEFPIIIGAVGILAAPIVSAIGLLVGVLSNFSIEIIKQDETKMIEIFEVIDDE